MRRDPGHAVEVIRQGTEQGFTLSVVTNKAPHSREVKVISRRPGKDGVSDSELGLSWPDDVYSLAHVALPFSPEDPLYGGDASGESPGISLGNIALRGERGVLQVAASDMLRLRWNPFYAYVEARLLEFVGLAGPPEPGARP